MFLPDCWLQFHKSKLLVSKTTTVSEQEQLNRLHQLTQAVSRLWFTSPRISTTDVQDCG